MAESAGHLVVSREFGSSEGRRRRSPVIRRREDDDKEESERHTRAKRVRDTQTKREESSQNLFDRSSGDHRLCVLLDKCPESANDTGGEVDSTMAASARTSVGITMA